MGDEGQQKRQERAGSHLPTSFTSHSSFIRECGCVLGGRVAHRTSILMTATLDRNALKLLF